MTTTPNRQLVTLALSNLGAHERTVHTEDIALEVNELAPERFTWRKYPQFVDINVVLQGLGDARRRRYGEHVVGSNVKGWMLTEAGQIWIKSVNESKQAGLSHLLSSRKGSLIVAQQFELHRLRMTEAFRLHTCNALPDITRTQFFDFARINEYFSQRARHRRFNFISGTVYGDAQLESLWSFVKSTFRNEFE